MVDFENPGFRVPEGKRVYALPANFELISGDHIVQEDHMRRKWWRHGIHVVSDGVPMVYHVHHGGVRCARYIEDLRGVFVVHYESDREARAARRNNAVDTAKSLVGSHEFSGDGKGFAAFCSTGKRDARVRMRDILPEPRYKDIPWNDVLDVCNFFS